MRSPSKTGTLACVYFHSPFSFSSPFSDPAHAWLLAQVRAMVPGD